MMLNSKQSNKPYGFSLIELLVAIAVIATIIGLALPNFLGARTRARDARRKGELSQLKTAVQLYYNDYKVFPPAANGTGVTNYIAGCGTDGETLCPAGCSVDFAAGATTGCDTVYMTNFPGELGTGMSYYSSSADFCIKVSLENVSDGDITSSQGRCSAACVRAGSVLSGADYAVCSE